MSLAPDELRIIGMSGAVWIRMLRDREERLMAKMYGEFRNGKTDHLTTIAEFACTRDQINELISAMKQNENQKG